MEAKQQRNHIVNCTTTLSEVDMAGAYIFNFIQGEIIEGTKNFKRRGGGKEGKKYF